MSGDDVFTIKEVIKSHMSDMKQSVSELHGKVDNIVIQTTKTNGRVNKLDEAVEKMTTIIEAHDEILIKNTATADTNKINSSRNWKIFAFTIFPVLSFLGWVGYLYIEHVKREIVTLSVQETTKLLENYQPEVIIK